MQEMRRDVPHNLQSAGKYGGACDKCGSELYQRDDDKEDTIEARLKVYEDETMPVVEHYKKKGSFKTVNGVGSMDDITQAIVGAIEKGSADNP